MMFTIPGRLPGVNEMNWEDRCGYRRGSRFKKKVMYQVAQWAMVGKVPTFKCPVHVHIRWFEKDYRRDGDNVQGAAKYILDGLKLRGCIVNDTRKWVRGPTHEVLVDKTNPRIEVSIVGVEDDLGAKKKRTGRSGGRDERKVA